MAVMLMLLVLVLVMVIFVRVFLGDMHVELRPGDARLLGAADVDVVAVKVQLGELVFELPGVDAKVQQRADKHVAADPANQIEVKGIHWVLGPSGWWLARALIWLAAKAAPKPLSILTTVMPLAQLLSMPSRAARPPKLAP